MNTGPLACWAGPEHTPQPQQLPDCEACFGPCKSNVREVIRPSGAGAGAQAVREVLSGLEATLVGLKERL